MTAPKPAPPAPRISSPVIASSESLTPTLNDAQIWQLVTFLSNVQKLPPAVLKELAPPAGATLEAAPAAPTAPAMHMH